MEKQLKDKSDKLDSLQELLAQVEAQEVEIDSYLKENGIEIKS